MVLVVDDDADILEYLKEIVLAAKPDIQVTLMTNPSQALTFVEQNSVKLILSDMRMPEMPGEKFFNSLRRITKVPVIFISGAFQEEFIDLIQNQDVSFFEKPFIEDELISKIRELLT